MLNKRADLHKAFASLFRNSRWDTRLGNASAKRADWATAVTFVICRLKFVGVATGHGGPTGLAELRIPSPINSRVERKEERLGSPLRCLLFAMRGPGRQ